MTIAYHYGDSLYLNITNLCSCSCVFCIRLGADGVGDGNNLWLEREPTVQEIISELEVHSLSQYGEIVFCGYGEPTERIDVLLEVCRYLKSVPGCPPVRLNTNGLSDLINGRETAHLLKGLVDVVSISLNAPGPARYVDVVQPVWGEKSFEAMLKFAEDCKPVIPGVVFTLVNILELGEVEACHDVASRHGIPLRVREKS